MAYDGPERRHINSDHDVLTRIDENLKNFLETFKKHVDDDAQNFDRLDTRTGRIEKIVWGAVGAVALVEIFIRVASFWK